MFNNKGSNQFDISDSKSFYKSSSKKLSNSTDKKQDIDVASSVERLNEKLISFIMTSNESNRNLEIKLQDLDVKLRNQMMLNETLRTEIDAVKYSNDMLRKNVSNCLSLSSKFESLQSDNIKLSSDFNALKGVVMDFYNKQSKDTADHLNQVQNSLFAEIKIMTESIEKAYNHRSKNLERLIFKLSVKSLEKHDFSNESCGDSSRDLDNNVDSSECSNDEGFQFPNNDKMHDRVAPIKTKNDKLLFEISGNVQDVCKFDGSHGPQNETKPLGFTFLNQTTSISTPATNTLFGSSDSRTNIFGTLTAVNKQNIFGEKPCLLSTPATSLFLGNKSEIKSSTTKSAETESQTNSKVNMFSGSSIFKGGIANKGESAKENVLTSCFSSSIKSKETEQNSIFGGGSNIPSFSSLANSAENGFGSSKETKWQGGSKLFSKPPPKEEGDSIKEDEFIEHDPEFKPIIELPPLIEIVRDDDKKTVLFKNRCKLYRFTNGEWKERGVGDMKILKSEIDHVVTLVMRREQIHKLCCNQRVTRDSPSLTPMGNDKSACWVAADFSDGESSMEKFAVKFSDKAIMDEFTRVLNDVKSSL